MRRLPRFLAVIAVAFTSLIIQFPPGHAMAATDSRNSYMLNVDTVKKVVCKAVIGGSSGSGSVIARDRVLTAAHVVRDQQSCMVDGEPAAVISVDKASDTAVLAVEMGDTATMPISCDGVPANSPLLGVGYAKGADLAVTVMEADDSTFDFQELKSLVRANGLFGRSPVYQGMSGGPVIDVESGRQVAVLTVGDMAHVAGVRALADTPVCAALRRPETKSVFVTNAELALQARLADLAKRAAAKDQTPAPITK